MDLKHALRQADANSCKRQDRLPFSVQVVDQRLHFGTSMPLRVGVHSIAYAVPYEAVASAGGAVKFREVKQLQELPRFAQ